MPADGSLSSSRSAAGKMAPIRPVSARYMHKKEVEHFVRQQQK
jgi:uncharacterized DUF497 family protein